MQTIRTPEKKERVLREIRKTGNAKLACSKAKIGKASWYEWLADDPDLAAAHKAAMDAGREAKADLAEDKLADRIEKGDTTAIIFALKSLRREVYGERATLEHTGPDGAPLTITLAERTDGPA